MSALKPCPFCGGTKIDLGQFEVYCQACGMGQFYHMDVTPEALTTAWNQRTTEEPDNRTMVPEDLRSLDLVECLKRIPTISVAPWVVYPMMEAVAELEELRARIAAKS